MVENYFVVVVKSPEVGKVRDGGVCPRSSVIAGEIDDGSIEVIEYL